MSHYDELMSVPPFPHTMYTHTASSTCRLQRRWWEKPSLHWPLQSTGSVSKRLAGWFPALACVLVCEQERERKKYVYAGYNNMLISVRVYVRVCLGDSKPDRILCFERQDVRSAVALMPHSGICTSLFVCTWVFPRLRTRTTCPAKDSSRRESDALECFSLELSQSSFSFH